MAVVVITLLLCSSNSLKSHLDNLETWVCSRPDETKLLNVTVLWLDFGKSWGDIIQIFVFSAGFILHYSIICVLTGYATKEILKWNRQKKVFKSSKL